MLIRTRLIVLILLGLGSATGPALALHPPPEATVTAKKGPIQITLRLYKKNVKREKSLWYQLELKNIGKKKIDLMDKVFRDPWAMHENCKSKYGVYLEVVGPPDAAWDFRSFGQGEVSWDYIREASKRTQLEGKDMEDLNAARAEWDKKGLTGTARAVALKEWNGKRNDRLRMEEDSKKRFWLAPGASTQTAAWAYWNPDPDAPLHKNRADLYDEEQPVGDYTQLWTFMFLDPGIYRIRAVYHHGVSKKSREMRHEDGIPIDPWEQDVKTPFIPFQVRR